MGKADRHREAFESQVKKKMDHAAATGRELSEDKARKEVTVLAEKVDRDREKNEQKIVDKEFRKDVQW